MCYQLSSKKLDARSIINWTVVGNRCYSNHIITRISIQTAGLAFGGTGLCSYHVRSVDSSCAEHSTVESYTVFICQQSYLLLFGDHPLTLSLLA